MGRRMLRTCGKTISAALFLGLLALVGVPAACFGDDLPVAKPEEVGLSPARLARIGPAMQRYIDKNLISGSVTLVARKGRVAHLEARGLKNVQAKEPMTADTIFRLASMTKPITTVACMMLYEEGHFLLSDPIKKWIPEFANPVVRTLPPPDLSAGETMAIPGTRDITILQLLTHTAGLSNAYRGINLEEYNKSQKLQSPNDTVGDVVKRYAKVPLNYHPGEAWEYSRATCVVGRLVEIVSGMTLDAFFRERIFKPLGMKDTYFYLPKEKLSRLSVAYRPVKEGGMAVLDPASEESQFMKEPPLYFMGSGGLIGTAADYFKFSQMLLNGGEYNGVRLLSRKTVELMIKNHIGDLPVWISGPYMGFGLGFAVAKDINAVKGALTKNQPGPLPWSTGTYTWGGAYCTYFWVDPVEKLIGILMTQLRPNSHIAIRSDFVGLATQAIAD
jgi:CubicO group peptidase (beta-lactamase class C family)